MTFSTAVRVLHTRLEGQILHEHKLSNCLTQQPLNFAVIAARIKIRRVRTHKLRDLVGKLTQPICHSSRSDSSGTFGCFCGGVRPPPIVHCCLN